MAAPIVNNRKADAQRMVSRMLESYVRMTDTTTRLIDGTVASVKRRGLAATTSREITSAAGVNLAGITYHFGSKDELVAQALLTTIRTWLAPARAALQQDADPTTRLLAAVAAVREALDQAEDLLPVYIDALAHAPHNDTLKLGLDELRRELRGFVAGEIAALKKSKDIPTWVDPDAMAALILAVADGLSVDASLGRDPREPLDQFVRLLVEARLRAGGRSRATSPTSRRRRS
jgi:AcrR family transcriptional regulator